MRRTRASCSRSSQRSRLANIIAVDFYRTGDVFRVAATINGLDPESSEPTKLLR
jgi:hypothetical protein